MVSWAQKNSSGPVARRTNVAAATNAGAKQQRRGVQTARRCQDQGGVHRQANGFASGTRATQHHAQRLGLPTLHVLTRLGDDLFGKRACAGVGGGG